MVSDNYLKYISVVVASFAGWKMIAEAEAPKGFTILPLEKIGRPKVARRVSGVKTPRIKSYFKVEI